MPQGDIETYHDQAAGGWLNKVEGNSTPASGGPYRTKAEAVAEGRKLAIFASKFIDASRRRTVEHIVRNEDGTIHERNTYPRQDDPPESRG